MGSIADVEPVVEELVRLAVVQIGATIAAGQVPTAIIGVLIEAICQRLTVILWNVLWSWTAYHILLGGGSGRQLGG